MRKEIIYLGILLTIFGSTQAQIPYFQYAYMETTSMGAVRISFVAPNIQEATPTHIDIVQSGQWEQPIYGFVSPDQRAVLVMSVGSQTGRIVDLLTGDIRDIPAGFRVIGNVRENSLSTWSPDGRYLLMRQTTRDNWDLYLYDLERREVTQVTFDNQHRDHTIWANNGESIASVTTRCNADGRNCASILEVFRIGSGERIISPEIQEFMPTSFGGACQLMWSPDERHISFVTGCDQGTSSAKDVAIWNLEDNSFRRATSFSDQVFEPGTFQYMTADYNIIWQSENHLLIGSTYQISTDTNALPVSNTYRFKITENELSLLFEGQTVEWEINPITGSIIARMIEPSDFNDEGFSNTTDMILGLEPTSIVNPSQGTTISTMGCDPHWSPDGTILSYTLRRGTECNGNITSIIFVDELQSMEEVTISASLDVSEGTLIRPLGWVLREQ